MPLKYLGKEKGYPIDLRPPNPDEIALKYSYKWFGEGVVDRVRERYRRAITTLDAIEEDIMQFDVQYEKRTQDPGYYAVLESVRQDFVPRDGSKIIPFTLGAVQQDSLPKDKSPGLPWKQMGYKTKREVLEDKEACDQMHKEWSLIGKGYKVTLPDTMIYFRAQICGVGTNKIRGTWGVPFTVILEEARFVYPYLDWIRHSKDDVPVAYGVEMATGGMGYVDEMFQRAGQRPKAVMCDWSGFDKKVPAWVIRDGFEILAQAFDMGQVKDSAGKVWSVDPVKTKRRWNKMVSYFINTPFILPSGKRYQKEGGVPSGTTFTNIMDTIINAIITRYTAYNVMGELPTYDMYMGDDSLFMTNRTVNLEDFAKFAESTFGMTLNVNKSYVTRRRSNISFLGFYNYYGYPIRDQEFLIASFIYPERYHEEHDPLFTATRAIGQMWSTLNGMSAMRWLDIIENIEKDYGLDTAWFDSFMSEHPGTLKFLGIVGLDSQKLYIPRRPGWKLDQVEPPLRSRRNPSSRQIDMEKLLYDFKTKYKIEEDYFDSFDRQHVYI